MKQVDIIKAYKDLEKLSDVQDFHSKEQWALYSLRKKMREHVDFYEERQKALIEKYREFADDNGIITGEKYVDYTKELSDLNDLEIDEEIEKISLPFVDGISFKTAESLENFIDFKSE